MSHLQFDLGLTIGLFKTTTVFCDVVRIHWFLGPSTPTKEVGEHGLLLLGNGGNALIFDFSIPPF
jgi:hypothetical protein